MRLVRTPFLGAQPASSPVLFLKYDLFLSIVSRRAMRTLREPFDVSLSTPVFGYGIGTPGGGGGVMQTSGKAQAALPLPERLDNSRELAKTWWLMNELHS